MHKCDNKTYAISAPAALALTDAALSARSWLRIGTALTSHAASLPSNGKLQNKKY